MGGKDGSADPCPQSAITDEQGAPITSASRGTGTRHRAAMSRPPHKNVDFKCGGRDIRLTPPHRRRCGRREPQKVTGPNLPASPSQSSTNASRLKGDCSPNSSIEQSLLA